MVHQALKRPRAKTPKIFSLVAGHINQRLLYTLNTKELKTHTPHMFLGIGYGDKEWLRSLFSSLPVAAYVLCNTCEDSVDPIQEAPPKSVYKVVWDKKLLPFSAIFDIAVVSWRVLLESPTDLMIRQVIACLKPGGRLYLVGLGECSFYEWFYACQQIGLPLSFPGFLNQRQPLWPEDARGTLHEEWIELFCPTREVLFGFFQDIKKNLVDYAPFAQDALDQAFDIFFHTRNGALTLHLFYGTYTKPQDIRDE